MAVERIGFQCLLMECIQMVDVGSRKPVLVSQVTVGGQNGARGWGGEAWIQGGPSQEEIS